jgi:dephospho-CoA kinase
MLLVALTGGIAAGKSVVARVFAARGGHVHSADTAARSLMSPGGPAYSPLVERFGRGILHPDGTIDRGALGRLVFGDAEARRFVDSVVHPLVVREMREEADRLEREGRTKVFVSEAALTYEAGLEGQFDRVVVVHCDPEVQVERLMARDGIAREAALARIGAQMPAEEKRRRADYVIDASEALEETLARAEAVFTLLVEEAERKTLNP